MANQENRTQDSNQGMHKSTPQQEDQGAQKAQGGDRNKTDKNRDNAGDAAGQQGRAPNRKPDQDAATRR